jgi:hypothetical protein
LTPFRSMAWAIVALGSAANAADIRFTYENPKLQPPQYVLTVNEDGTGRFQSQAGGPPGDNDTMPAEPQDRPIHISKSLREGIFAAARKNKLFAINCEDGGKNIAFQGKKTLAYEGAEGQGSCTYNWSKNAQINKLTDQFEAMATTLEEGSRLERQYEHGRLTLDAEMEVLEQMVHDGRAIEVENIAPILQKLANDEAVLQRVQRRARTLLQGIPND